eukprot:905018-Prymnesium_polylepis.1
MSREGKAFGTVCSVTHLGKTARRNVSRLLNCGPQHAHVDRVTLSAIAAILAWEVKCSDVMVISSQ